MPQFSKLLAEVNRKVDERLQGLLADPALLQIRPQLLLWLREQPAAWPQQVVWLPPVMTPPGSQPHQLPVAQHSLKRKPRPCQVQLAPQLPQQRPVQMPQSFR